MKHRSMILRAIAVLAIIWGVTFAVRSYAASRKPTAASLERQIQSAKIADWSERDGEPQGSEAKQREETILEIAETLNRLDFAEREKNRESRSGEEFFRKLSPAEKSKFIDLTIMESMNRFMEALDQMPPEQRRQFVEKGLREVTEGRTAEDLERAEKLGADLVARISQEGMRAYFEKSSTETKLDLAPLMEAINETMQGLRGNQFGPPTHQ
jgi:DNA-directed RNA polymerase specialized sigma24 family protein